MCEEPRLFVRTLQTLSQITSVDEERQSSLYRTVEFDRVPAQPCKILLACSAVLLLLLLLHLLPTSPHFRSCQNPWRIWGKGDTSSLPRRLSSHISHARIAWCTGGVIKYSPLSIVTNRSQTD